MSIARTSATGTVPPTIEGNPDRGFLYSLSGNPRAIHIYEIAADGGLAEHAQLSGISPTAAGLVAR